MSSDIKSIIERISFRDEIAKPTEIKEEIKTALSSVGLNAMDFNDEVETVTEEITNYPARHAPIDVEVEEYDAEANARSLVYTLTAFDSLLLSAAVQVKCHKNAGGLKMVKKMKTAISKEFTNAPLTEADKAMIAKFKEFKSNMQMLTGEISPTTTDFDRMIESAIPYCEATQFKMSAGFAFWSNYSGNLVQRVTKILIS